MPVITVPRRVPLRTVVSFLAIPVFWMLMGQMVTRLRPSVLLSQGTYVERLHLHFRTVAFNASTPFCHNRPRHSPGRANRSRNRARRLAAAQLVLVKMSVTCLCKEEA